MAAIQAGLDKSNALVSVWSYNPTAGTYTSWQSSPPNYPSDLAVVAPGKGYWVQVNANAVLTLSGPVWSGSNILVPGWNLVGFAGLSQDAASSVTLDAVFRDRFGRIPQVWTFQSGATISGGQRFVGYDSTARPNTKDVKTIVPGQGYWVYCLDGVTLSPARCSRTWAPFSVISG
ncbi:MAG: hypothetical protein EBS84_17695 [Proteobacteria bacterium]|nr:hypothetical protein [Pseudomonadota bacterium]